MTHLCEIPGPVVEQMTDGVSAIRAFRQHGRHSLSRVADHTGIGSDRLRSLETSATPGREELELLAKVLGVPADVLGGWR